MGITNKDVLKTVAIDVPNLKTQMDNNIQQTTQNTSNINSLANSKADKTEINRLDTELDHIMSNEVIKECFSKNRIVAHRALPNCYPENSIPAFYECFKNGIKFIETDFRKTSDGEWVCYHDSSTGRLCDTDLVVANTPFNTLINLKLTKGTNSSIYGVPKIASIDDVLKFMADTKTYVFLNFDYGILESDMPTIVEKIDRFNVREYAILDISFAKVDSKFCFSCGGILTDDFFKSLQYKKSTIVSFNMPTSASVPQINTAMELGKKYGIPIIIYTVLDYREFKLINYNTNVNMIMVDNLWFRKGEI